MDERFGLSFRILEHKGLELFELINGDQSARCKRSAKSQTCNFLRNQSLAPTTKRFRPFIHLFLLPFLPFPSTLSPLLCFTSFTSASFFSNLPVGALQTCRSEKVKVPNFIHTRS